MAKNHSKKTMNDLKTRFENSYMPEPNSGCWLWIKSADKGGYGVIGDNYKLFRAHRIAYEMYRDPIPDHAHVLHKCDVRCCVNPSHLFLGTHEDNMADMMAKRERRRGKKPIKEPAMPRDAKAETRLEREFRDEIDAIAKEAERTRSKMIEILLKEAVAARKRMKK